MITEAALRSGIPKGAINRRSSERRAMPSMSYPEREGGKPQVNAAWDAIGEVIKAWATEGHSVAVPGLGTMRFGLRSKSVADVNEVGTSLITMRRVIFTPNVDIKDELKRTAINITCYDRNGEVVKRVTSSDDAEIEDNETGGGNDNVNANDNANQGSGSGSSNTNGSNQTNGSESGGSGGSGNDNENQNENGGGSSSGGSESGGSTGGDGGSGYNFG